MTVDVITMGCSKNLVDSERLMRQLQDAGFDVTHDSDAPCGEIAVINTCGFIGDAKEESINTILRFAQAKSNGHLKKLYVMGCLSERYLEELGQEIPEVDRFFGKFNWPELLNELGHEFHSLLYNERILTTPPHYAYIKISEGCSRCCAYCAIPNITGQHVSRPMEEILDEVHGLVARGVREFQIIAQELTYYGLDIYGERKLAQLVDKMAEIDGVEWIRLHYAYPTDFPYELLPVIARHQNVCKYLDIALQHIADPVLKAMHRHVTGAETRALIEKLRHDVPGIAIRTTLMVGHPGETEEAFNELMEFVRWARFDRMGAFAYCEEEGTYSAEHYADDIPAEVKQERLNRLMRLQQRISAEKQAEKVGQTLKVVIDRLEGDYWIGRTEYDSPEVDPEVLLPAVLQLQVGEFYEVQVTGSDDFDLYATLTEK